jgi:hypothetical protein
MLNFKQKRKGDSVNFRFGIVLRNKFSVEYNSLAMVWYNLRFNLRHLGRQKLNNETK